MQWTYNLATETEFIQFSVSEGCTDSIFRSRQPSRIV